MNETTTTDILKLAIVIPVATLAAVTVARFLWRTTKRIGRWLVRLLRRFYTETVREAVAPELAHLAKKLTASVDQMREANTADHIETSRRLTEVEQRLEAVEAKLDIRPSDARTRSTDKED